jgi:hypothetical protein
MCSLTFDFYNYLILFKALGQCDSRPLPIDFVRFTFLTSPRSQYLDFSLLFDIVF